MQNAINKGPKYLEGLTNKLPKNRKNQWRGQLISSTCNKKFRIKYFGDIERNWIVMTEKLIPQKVIAEDLITKEEIVLFDGALHGYNAMFVDEYDKHHLSARAVKHIYTFKNETIFEIEIIANYGIDYDAEEEGFKAEVDKNGMIKLINGKILPFEVVKRNGFDWFEIIGTLANGKTVEIISEELA